MPGKIFHHTQPLEAYAWPGGYPIFYEVQGNGIGGLRTFQMCPHCATLAKHTGRDPHGRALVSITPHVHYEGAPIECEADGSSADDCMGEIESAYGDPGGDEGITI